MFAVVHCDDNRTSHTEQLDSLLAESFVFFFREREFCVTKAGLAAAHHNWNTSEGNSD